MSTVNSDLASLLSQYRVMTYHNLETDRDEGLVFVKQGEDTSTGELVSWTGDNSVVPGTDTTSPNSTSPSISTPVSSPCSSQGQSSSSSSGMVIALPTTSQESPKPPTLSQDNLTMTISRSPSSSREESQTGDQSSSLTLPGQECTKQSGSTDVHNKKKHSSFGSKLSRVKKSSKPAINLNNNSNLASLTVSQKEPDLPEVYQKLNREVDDKCDTASSNTMKDKTVHSRSEVQKNLEMYKVSGEAGWVREVVRGDRKCSNPDKLRIAYLPPTSIRYMKTRLYSKTQLQAFLSSHCPNSTLTQDNFSFSACVLGLDMPWEVIRPAYLTLEQVMSGQTMADINKNIKLVLSPPPPASCLHCGQQLPHAQSAAALHVRRCLHSKNARMRTMLDCDDYSPLQHARPVKYKQNMPGMMVIKPESEITPDKTSTQPGQCMPEKTTTQTGRQSMPDKTGQHVRKGMSEKTATQPSRQGWPDRTPTQPGRHGLPDKTATQPGRQNMPDKTATQSGRQNNLKTENQASMQGMLDETATHPRWQRNEQGITTDHHSSRQGMTMTDNTVCQPDTDSLHSRASLSLSSLPDCISVSKLSL